MTDSLVCALRKQLKGLIKSDNFSTKETLIFGVLKLLFSMFKTNLLEKFQLSGSTIGFVNKLKFCFDVQFYISIFKLLKISLKTKKKIIDF